jgi:hypothetical protein
MIDLMAKEANGIDEYTNEFKNKLADLLANPKKETFIQLLKDYPQSKTFFIAAIEKISG